MSETTIEDFEEELSYWDAGEDYYEYEYEYDGGYEEDYSWDERDNPCSSSYFIQDRKVSCNVIASNFGITAKGFGNNSIAVAVADIITTQPSTGVNINILNYQQQVIGTGTTDGNGFAVIEAKGKPFLLLAEKDQQKDI
ncbi:MAG: hypothetical protein HC905_27680 [Bacteroidales bacterium]|nr:hypothetical protein [Bacteroidales bacterium]